MIEERVQCGATECVAYKSQKEKILTLPIPVEAATNLQEVEEYNKKESAKSDEQKKEEERERKAAGISEPEPVRPLVPLSACINSLFAPEFIQDWFSSAANQSTHCIKQRRFSTFPPYLVLHMARFLVAGMELKKLGCPNEIQSNNKDAFIDVPDEIDLEYLRGKGLQPGEKPMPEGKEAKKEIVVSTSSQQL